MIATVKSLACVKSCTGGILGYDVLEERFAFKMLVNPELVTIDMYLGRITLVRQLGPVHID